MTGAHNGLFISTPGVKGHSITTTTQSITASNREQTIAVADSSVFAITGSQVWSLSVRGWKLPESSTLSTPTGQPHVVAYGLKGAASFTLTKASNTAAAASAGADCIAMHD